MLIGTVQFHCRRISAGPMLELRGELRDALRATAPIVGRPFHAVYTAAEDGEFADVENVLLYNVGTSATRRALS